MAVLKSEVGKVEGAKVEVRVESAVESAVDGGVENVVEVREEIKENRESVFMGWVKIIMTCFIDLSKELNYKLLAALLLIIIGIIAIVLSCIDPVNTITYTYSVAPNTQHSWNCINFQICGVIVGVLSIITGFVVNKIDINENNRIWDPEFCKTFVLLCVWILPVGFIFMFTLTSARDDEYNNQTNMVATTTEGFLLYDKTKCGEYMANHHLIGLIGSLIVPIVLSIPLLVLLSSFLFYLISCKSICDFDFKKFISLH